MFAGSRKLTMWLFEISAFHWLKFLWVILTHSPLEWLLSFITRNMFARCRWRQRQFYPEGWMYSWGSIYPEWSFYFCCQSFPAVTAAAVAWSSANGDTVVTSLDVRFKRLKPFIGMIFLFKAISLDSLSNKNQKWEMISPLTWQNHSNISVSGSASFLVLFNFSLFSK